MSNRHKIIVRNASDRERLAMWAAKVPAGWHVDFRAPTRSLEQNARLWAILGDVAKQAEIGGRKFDDDAWKCIFMKAMGKEAEFLPTLDGSSFFPTGFRSSQLTVREMSDMQTFIEAFMVEKGILSGSFDHEV